MSILARYAKRLAVPCIAILAGSSSCTKESAESGGDIFSTGSASAGGSSSGASSNPSAGNGGGQAGVITAGEWNDLDNWAFWTAVMAKDAFKNLPDYWRFYTDRRVAVRVVAPDSTPVVNAAVKLKRDGALVFSARTDNTGRAEVWADLFQKAGSTDFSGYSIDVADGAHTISTVAPASAGVNYAVVSGPAAAAKIEVAFVVDATGSMGDELEYLKTELADVVSRVKATSGGASVRTASVFYRDEGDEYVTRISPFATDASTTINFIKAQSAGGGGDTPEAVHSALQKALDNLQWSGDARTRILFLMLDAPPHSTQAVIADLQVSVLKAAAKGIKIIPITASGIDVQTEYIMRAMAMATAGTYVFITNHSGIGNPHLEATVGPYQVEYLNNLMVRVIGKYYQ